MTVRTYALFHCKNKNTGIQKKQWNLFQPKKGKKGWNTFQPKNSRAKTAECIPAEKHWNCTKQALSI